MGRYIVKKNIFFYCNGVGGALRGTRQGPVLKYLWYLHDFWCRMIHTNVFDRATYIM